MFQEHPAVWGFVIGLVLGIPVGAYIWDVRNTKNAKDNYYGV